MLQRPWLHACLPFWMIACAAGCSSLERVSPLAPLEKSLIYQPQPFPDGFVPPAGLALEDATFESADGNQLHGWFLDHPDPIGVALFCHGNAGSIAGRAKVIQELNQRHRLAVMTFDYRGYGKSAGRPNEQGILMDARAARRWLGRRKGMPERDIIVIGRSLGGAVAVDLAANDGARALVLNSTFTSLPDAASQHMSWLPTHWIMTQRLNSLAKISRYKGPLLCSHGDADRVIPIALGRKLFDAASEPKRFVEIPGGGHNSPPTESYRVALDKFLASLPGPASRGPTTSRPQLHGD